MKIRVVKTGSGAKAVQVVSYQDNKRIILKHFGSSHSELELEKLSTLARDWIHSFAGQLSLFPERNLNSFLSLDHSTFLGVYYSFFYNLIGVVQSKIGLDTIGQSLLHDLVAIRIFEPASKLRSIELLETYFGVIQQRKSFYKFAKNWVDLKSKVELIVSEFAREEFLSDFDIVFYDVTTLYFETFQEDELRKNGFSKDNKSQQPQILIALMVTRSGFPIAYEIFPGNTFEGNTILPVLKSFKDKNKVQTLTVVADAAMISSDNVKELQKQKIKYIVGARLGNIPDKLLNQIDSILPREDGKNVRLNTDKGYLICSYSEIRKRKDQHEMEKQIEKAKAVIEKPSKNKKLKFTKSEGEKIALNEELISKAKKLLGIKGYYTDLTEAEACNQTIITRYHELYRIEQAFRISKSDLQTRPVYHFKEDPIKLHILICFMALVIAKHIELKTGDSISKFVSECKKITDARILNHITNKEIRMRTEISVKAAKYIADLS